MEEAGKGGALGGALLSPVYSFSCAMKLSTCFVPFPTHTMTSPVAMGSRVPACPTCSCSKQSGGASSPRQIH